MGVPVGPLRGVIAIARDRSDPLRTVLTLAGRVANAHDGNNSDTTSKVGAPPVSRTQRVTVRQGTVTVKGVSRVEVRVHVASHDDGNK